MRLPINCVKVCVFNNIDNNQSNNFIFRKLKLRTYEFLYNYLEIIRFYSVKQITLLVVKRLFYVINFGVVYKSHNDTQLRLICTTTWAISGSEQTNQVVSKLKVHKTLRHQSHGRKQLAWPRRLNWPQHALQWGGQSDQATPAQLARSYRTPAQKCAAD